MNNDKSFKFKSQIEKFIDFLKEYNKGNTYIKEIRITEDDNLSTSKEVTITLNISKCKDSAPALILTNYTVMNDLKEVLNCIY